MNPKFERITDENGNLIGQRKHYPEGTSDMRLLDHEGNYTPWEPEALPEDATQNDVSDPTTLLNPDTLLEEGRIDSDTYANMVGYMSRFGDYPSTIEDIEADEFTPEMAADMMHNKEEDWNAKVAAQELLEEVREEIDMHVPGAKDDASKQRAALVLGGFAGALEEVIEVGTFGAEKYTPNGWMHVNDARDRYFDAAMRHWLKTMNGNIRNQEDGNVRHLAQCIWNLLAVLEFELAEERRDVGSE